MTGVWPPTPIGTSSRTVVQYTIRSDMADHRPSLLEKLASQGLSGHAQNDAVAGECHFLDRRVSDNDIFPIPMCGPVAIVGWNILSPIILRAVVALWLLGILTIGSLVCAVAPGLSVMIIGRALQGMGMGVIPLGISLLGDVVDENKLGTSIALVSATLGVGGAIGLPISALVVENADWHILFVFAALVALISLVWVVLVVPRSAAQTGGHVDFVGAGGLAVGLVGVLLAVSQGNTWGWGSLPTLLSLAIGLVVLLAWGWFELRSKNPLVDLRVNARPAVLTTNLASIAMGFALFASTVAFPQLLQASTSVGGMGLELLPASLALVPSGLAMLATSPVAGRVERNFGPKPLLIAGALVLVLAYILCGFVPLQVWSVAVINAVIGVGIGLGTLRCPHSLWLVYRRMKPARPMA